MMDYILKNYKSVLYIIDNILPIDPYINGI